jgi:hypothetical protein
MAEHLRRVGTLGHDRFKQVPDETSSCHPMQYGPKQKLLYRHAVRSDNELTPSAPRYRRRPSPRTLRVRDRSCSRRAASHCASIQSDPRSVGFEKFVRWKTVWTLPSLWTQRTRPQVTWKTAQTAVFHSAHTDHSFLQEEKEQRRILQVCQSDCLNRGVHPTFVCPPVCPNAVQEPSFRSHLGHAFASASRFRKAASPASDTSTHFWSGEASAS